MTCPRCGTVNPAGSRFCGGCGFAVAERCPGCGAAVGPGQRFCGDCGAPLGGGADAAGRTRPPSVGPAVAERRQLTTMFCDFVGSTALSARIDPEDLADVIARYHRCVGRAVAPFGGYVARVVGDGALIYFGYPEAHEDDPERAVRAGLAVIEEVSRLAPLHGEEPRVRVGIATGRVVLGTLGGGGEPHEVAGEAPNLAARLQALAAPGTVVIAATTRRLLGARFEFRDLGAFALKGFPAPVQAFQVLRPGRLQGRAGTLHAPETTPIIGREEELATLLAAWADARGGNGRAVLLTGEAGIGKSRLAAALQARIAADPHVTLRCFCSPYHVNSALYPIIRHIEHAAGIKAGHPLARKEEKLRQLFVHSTPDELALMLRMVLSSAGERPEADPTPSRKHGTATLRALVAQMERLAGARPVLVLIEDAHWADPTSLELLRVACEAVRGIAVLLLVTARPEFAPGADGALEAMTLLPLARLPRADGARLVECVAGRKRLPRVVVDFIVGHTDGVPLYAEEMTKSLIEGGLVREAGERFVLAGPLPSVAVPTSLQASLTARLDRLGGAARELAQVAAVIGREFSRDMLALVADRPAAWLDATLAKLVESGLVLADGEPPPTTFHFKHALVRDAAYDTLVRERRRALHRRVGGVIERHFPDLAAAQPDLLARHHAEAGDLDRAVHYGAAAGQQAIGRSAMPEAVAHLQGALGLIGRLPETPARHRQELALQASLGNALIAARGYSDPATGQAFERARALSERMGDTPSLIRVVHGQWSFHLMRAEMGEALRVARELLGRADGTASVDLRLNGLRLSGATLVQTGQVEAGCAQLDAAAAIIGAAGDSVGLIVQGNDALVGVPAYHCIGLALLGRYDAARAASAQAIAAARRSGRPHRQAFALGVAGCWFYGILDEDAPELHAEWGAVAEEQDFPFWEAYVGAYRGLVRAKAGRLAEGVALVRESSDRLMSLGAAWGPPYFLATAARLQGGARGLAMLDEAAKLAGDTGVRWFAPELHRTRGELLHGAGDDAAAECLFRRAMEEARAQGSRHWELRAALSLARGLEARGQARAAEAVLAGPYRAIRAEGDVAELRQAAALLARISA